MRDDFSDEVKRNVGARVGNVCSCPECRAHTSGPQDDPAKALNVGVAAHITSAAPGGPRYNAALTTEERRSPENAIWLCQNHAKLVDNDVARFSESLLQQWKKDAEAEALSKIGRTMHVPSENQVTPVVLFRPPRIVPIEYGPIPENHTFPFHTGQTGFHLVNDGEVAYQVMIQPFEIETDVWAMSRECVRIEPHGKEFSFVWLDGYGPSPIDFRKWDLLGAMRKAANRRDGESSFFRSNYSVNVSVDYRDADNHWYRTKVPLSYIPSQGRLEFGSPIFEYK